MKRATKILDEIARKDRMCNIRAVVISLVLISSLLLVGFLLTVGQSTQVHGTVKGQFGLAGDQGERMFLLVALEDGEQVKVSLPGSVPYVKESRVIALETTTRLFGYKRYAFLRYTTSELPSNVLANPFQ